MNRRSLLKSLGFVGASTLLAKSASAADWFWEDEKEDTPFQGKPLDFSQPSKFQINETRTPEKKITSYNNFYEFDQLFKEQSYEFWSESIGKNRTNLSPSTSIGSRLFSPKV